MAVRRLALSVVALMVAATLTACAASGRTTDSTRASVVVCSGTRYQRTPSCFHQRRPVSTSHARGCRVSPGPRWCLTYANTRRQAKRDLLRLLTASR